ncbi:MAG TPA: hypothetical protein VL123_04150 [Candidatus Udaeobacter sp.]|jgi:hypothetical protein|nr:hypothetical protein [Candidatus Udaeobacter sp.]
MQRPTTGERATTSFAVIARAAIEKHVPESRTGSAVWRVSPGMVWVRWPRGDGSWFALGLRRHLDWVTGEAALSREDADPETLPLWTDPEGSRSPAGYRIRLGVLLHDEDRWWPAGTTARALSERLHEMALQLRVKAEPHFARNPVPRT